MTILAVTMAATASSVIRALQVSDDSRKSVIAANIAQFELERLRAIPFVDWVVSGTGSTIAAYTDARTGPNGIEYEVYTEPRWVSAGSDTDSCTQRALGNTEDEDYVRVRQVVSFPNDPELTPIENITIVTPRLDFYDPNTGNLIIRVEDRDGGPSPGHQVEVQGPSGLRLGTVDTDGCVFFPYLPAGTGGTNYQVRIDSPEFVELETRVQAIDETVNVAPQTTTPLSFTYDEGASFDLRPIPQLPEPAGCTYVVSTRGPQPYLMSGSNTAGIDDPSGLAVDPENGGAPDAQVIQCQDGSNPSAGPGTPNPVIRPFFEPRIPHNLGYTVNSTGLLFPSEGVVTYPRLDNTAVPDTVSSPGYEVCGAFDGSDACLQRSLFPYRAGADAFAGRCVMADPTTVGGARSTLITDPLTVASVDVPMVPIAIRTIRHESDGSVTYNFGTRDVYADMQDDADCPGGDRLYLGRSDANGYLQAMLPYGEWVLHWDNAGNGAMRAGSTPLNCDAVQAAENGGSNNLYFIVANLLLSPTSLDYLDSACIEIRADGTGPQNVTTGDPLMPYHIDVRRGDRVVP